MINQEYRLTRAEVCLVIEGLPLALAEKIINLNNYDFRFACKDGKGIATTSEINNSRITISTMADVVIEASPW